MMIPDALLTISELGLGLAGFSGVILVFEGSPETMHPVDWTRIRMLLTVSLGTMVLSLVPFGLEMFDSMEPGLWRVACGFSATWNIVMGAIFFPDVLRLTRDERAQLFAGERVGYILTSILFALGIIAFLAHLLFAAGALGGNGAGLFFLGTVWLLVLAAYLFASLVFDRPMRR